MVALRRLGGLGGLAVVAAVAASSGDGISLLMGALVFVGALASKVPPPFPSPSSSANLPPAGTVAVCAARGRQGRPPMCPHRPCGAAEGGAALEVPRCAAGGNGGALGSPLDRRGGAGASGSGWGVQGAERRSAGGDAEGDPCCAGPDCGVRLSGLCPAVVWRVVRPRCGDGGEGAGSGRPGGRVVRLLMPPSVRSRACCGTPSRRRRRGWGRWI